MPRTRNTNLFFLPFTHHIRIATPLLPKRPPIRTLKYEVLSPKPLRSNRIVQAFIEIEQNAHPIWGNAEAAADEGCRCGEGLERVLRGGWCEEWGVGGGGGGAVRFVEGDGVGGGVGQVFAEVEVG